MFDKYLLSARGWGGVKKVDDRGNRGREINWGRWRVNEQVFSHLRINFQISFHRRASGLCENYF